MTDFLTNLAARAIATPALRPRTRFRYEPPAEGDVAPAFAESSSAREISPPPPVLTARPAATRESEAEPDAVRDNPPPRRQLTSEEPRRDQAPRQEVTAGPVTGRKVERETTTVHHIDTRVEHETNTIHHTGTKIEHETVAAKRVVVESVRPASPPLAAAAPPHRYDEEPPRVALEKREPADDRSPAHATAPDALPAAPPPPVQTARVVPREPAPHMDRRPAAQPPRRSPPPAAEPTVHVTIGRVEVRAVTAPPATPRASRRGAAMTIEDYAAKRNARERR